MVTQSRVLKFFEKRVAEGRPALSYEDLVREFPLSPEAACDHLKRLWRERLIEAVTFRPRRFRFRLQAEESLRQLRFRLAGRGQERLAWYREQKENERWPF